MRSWTFITLFGRKGEVKDRDLFAGIVVYADYDQLIETPPTEHAMSKGNATYLFREPSKHHHHSESFWTSLFAISLLVGSRSSEGLHIPAFDYWQGHNDNEWRFEPNGSLDFCEP